MVAHAETDAMPRVERTSAFDVTLTIGPAQEMSMGNTEMMMTPQQADQPIPLSSVMWSSPAAR